MKNNLKIGICQWCIPSQGVSAIRVAANMRYKGIVADMGKAQDNFPLNRPDYLLDINREREKYGICITTVAVNELCQTGMAIAENYNYIDYIIKEAVKCAVALEANILQLPSFGNGLINSEADFCNTASCLKNACKVAGEKGLIVGTENALTVQGNLRMLDEVAEPNLKIYFDTANPLFLAGGMYAPEMLKAMLDKICEIHVKDVSRNPDDGKFYFVPLGMGETDFEKSIMLIKGSSLFCMGSTHYNK